MVQSFVEQLTEEEVGINPPWMPRIRPPKRPKHRRPFDPGFVQAPPPRQEDIPPPQTFEVPKVPTHTQTFGVPQVPTTGGGFLAPSGPGQPATSTVPSLSPSSGGGGGFGIDGSTLALGGGAAALAAALGAAGQKANGGGGILSPENILSGLSKIGDLTGLTGDGSILDKLLPEGFDLTSLPENVVESVSNFLGIDSTFMPGSKAGEAFQLGPTEGIPEFGGMEINLTAGQELANLPGPPSPGAAAYATNFGPVGSLFPGAAANTAALMAAPGFAATVSTMPVMGVAGATSQISLLPSMGALSGATAAPAASMMGAMGPGLLAIGAIMALKASNQKDPGTLAAEAEQLFDHVSAVKSIIQREENGGVEEAIKKFGYEQVVEAVAFIAPGAPDYTSPLLRDQRRDHAVLETLPANTPRGKELLEFAASNRGNRPLHEGTKKLIEQLNVSTAPSDRMEKEMAWAMKQKDDALLEYMSPQDIRRMEKAGIRDANVAAGKLQMSTDEYGIKSYNKPNLPLHLEV